MVTDPFDDLAAQMAAQPEPDPLKVGLIRQRLLAAMEEEAGLAPRRARRVFRRGELLSVPESRRFALSVAVIAVLAVAVFLVPLPELFHFGPGTRRVIAPTATTRVSPAERPPAAAGFEPLAFGAAGAKDQWVLGSVPCDKSRLCAAIVRTTDDGASFARVAAPKSGLEVANGQFKELGIFFADASHGWVFGPGLWSSDDGGATWVEEHLSGAVMDVQASDGEVYVLLCPQGLSGCLGEFISRHGAVAGSGWGRALGGPLPPRGLALRLQPCGARSHGGGHERTQLGRGDAGRLNRRWAPVRHGSLLVRTRS